MLGLGLALLAMGGAALVEDPDGVMIIVLRSRDFVYSITLTVTDTATNCGFGGRTIIAQLEGFGKDGNAVPDDGKERESMPSTYGI